MINVSNNDYLDVANTEINQLPEGISISTMCASCKLNTKINILNIEKYMELSSEDILIIKFNDERIKTLINIKNKPKRRKNEKKIKKKTNNYFYNQITVVVRVTNGEVNNLNTVPKINMKLFKNGSIQMSGCKSISNINIALNKLITKLKEIKAIIEDNKIIEKLFVEDNSELTILNFKIDMINTNYKINMLIDRTKLYKLLLQKKIKATYEPCIRACVIIKYVPPYTNNYDYKEVSIFIFQKGNIIITGAKSQDHIIFTYNYINNILMIHKNDIIKKNETQIKNMVTKYHNDIVKEIDIGLISLSLGPN
jgi:TATA-box binding protein (TBP) (component of TFIID and TFIIIB)